MAWARYDDEFPMNRKVGRLIARGKDGVAAIGLHLLANTYCRHNGTAGHVEAHVPNLLVGPVGRKLALLLEEEGMFDPAEQGGWMIHDYAEFHDPNDPDPDRSAADRKKELSEKRAAAGRLGGIAKAKQRSSKATDLPEAKGVAKGKQTPSPVPVPVPVPVVDENLPTSVSQSVEGEPTDDDDRIAKALDLRALAVAQRKGADDVRAYARKARRNDEIERAPACRAYLDEHPDATVHELAMNVLGLSELDIHRIGKEIA